MQNDEVLMLFPRSSSPKKQGIMFPHSAGIIDADYYGNIDNDGHITTMIVGGVSKKSVTKELTDFFMKTKQGGSFHEHEKDSCRCYGRRNGCICSSTGNSYIC